MQSGQVNGECTYAIPVTGAYSYRCDLFTGGATALHRAAFMGHTSIVQLLLDHQANVMLQDSDGKTALHKVSSKIVSAPGIVTLGVYQGTYREHTRGVPRGFTRDIPRGVSKGFRKPSF